MFSNPKPPSSQSPGPADAFRARASSFHSAARWLPAPARRSVTELYCFLRTIDDLVDEAADAGQAAARLDALISRIPEADVKGQVRLSGVTFALDRTVLMDFLEGQKSDLLRGPVKTEAELVSYCYKVAGTVGIMLCPILGARGEVARLAALRLGIAMQLTNIARDIMEDARRGRLYVPSPWLPPTIGPADISQGDHASEVAISMRRLLQLAERYYKSAANGFAWLPVRQRFVVILAMRLYRQIGLKIMAAPEKALRGRVRLTGLERARQFVHASLQWLFTLRSSPVSDAVGEETARLTRFEA